MATRANIRDAFYAELTAAAATTHTITYDDGSTDTVTLSADDVNLMNPEGSEELPRVVYTENYTTVGYNGAGAGPHWVERDSNGDVVSSSWREYIEAQFIVEVHAGSEVEKEPIYEAIRQAFHKYHFAPWSESNFQADVFDIRVLDSESTDVGAAEDRIRGDELEIYVRFHRDYVLDTDNITQINLDSVGTIYSTT